MDVENWPIPVTFTEFDRVESAHAPCEVVQLFELSLKLVVGRVTIIYSWDWLVAFERVNGDLRVSLRVELARRTMFWSEPIENVRLAGV